MCLREDQTFYDVSLSEGPIRSQDPSDHLTMHTWSSSQTNRGRETQVTETMDPGLTTGQEEKQQTPSTVTPSNDHFTFIILKYSGLFDFDFLLHNLK